MRVLAILLTFLGALAATPLVSGAEPCAGDGHGKLLIHGGGQSSQDYTVRGMDLCGGSKAHVVLVPYAGVPSMQRTARRGSTGLAIL